MRRGDYTITIVFPLGRGTYRQKISLLIFFHDPDINNKLKKKYILYTINRPYLVIVLNSLE